MKEMLSNAPHFKADQGPDFGHPEYAGGVYRAYQVEPYFTTNFTTKADKTARNVRDRNDATLTPFDQGNSKTDVATTGKITRSTKVNVMPALFAAETNSKCERSEPQPTLKGPPSVKSGHLRGGRPPFAGWQWAAQPGRSAVRRRDEFARMQSQLG